MGIHKIGSAALLAMLSEDEDEDEMEQEPAGAQPLPAPAVVQGAAGLSICARIRLCYMQLIERISAMQIHGEYCCIAALNNPHTLGHAMCTESSLTLRPRYMFFWQLIFAHRVKLQSGRPPPFICSL
jgi:hypothetical protein